MATKKGTPKGEGVLLVKDVNGNNQNDRTVSSMTTARDEESASWMEKSTQSQKGFAVKKGPNGEETLTECSDREWKSAAPAYNSTLLNIKKKANKPTVFAAPEMKNGGQTKLKEVAIVSNTTTAREDQSTALGRLVNAITETIIQGKHEDVEIEITMRVNGKKTSIRTN